ncbi:hypothetical protein CIHUM_07935 [Corynebacterium ihumii]|uniref:Transposase n=1 Tax=Corynebacterium ihumii TaxID=1232427 RepID=A0ABY7UFC4_9CORY|nr:hypothetical protein CIHUM_07935 [Corynebacterium ihumii]
MKRNGTTSKGTTRWRCKQCGASSVKHRGDITNVAVFTQFIEHCTTATSLDDLAKRNGVSRATMKRRFKWCWFVDVPDPTAGHDKRVYDQIFLDGTYTAGGCLIVAATIDHVIAWHWCKHETTRDYQLLLERIEAPLIAVIDGGQGTYSAIKEVLADHENPTLPRPRPTRGTPLHHQQPTHRCRAHHLPTCAEADPDHHAG